MNQAETAALVRPSSDAINQARADKQQAIQDWGRAYVSDVGLVTSRLLSACIWHGLGRLKGGVAADVAAADAVCLLREGFLCMSQMGYALWDCDAELREALRTAMADALAPCYLGEVHPTAPAYLPGLRGVYAALAAALPPSQASASAAG